MVVFERDLTESEARIKEQFVDELGYWTEEYDAALRLDSEYFDYFRTLMSPDTDHGVLEPKVREFVLIAVNNAVTHMNETAVRIHIENAFDCGATFEEVKQVVLLSTGLGIHSVTDGVPMLIEEGDFSDQITGELDSDQQRVKDRFETERGYWSSFWESVVQLDHEFLDDYTDLSSYSRQFGPLDPKTIELITIGEDAATTHLYLPGLRVHFQNALTAGATEQEILEVLELISTIGMQSFGQGASILLDVANDRNGLFSAADSP